MPFYGLDKIHVLSKLLHPAPSPHQISWCCCAMHSVHTASSNVHTVQIGFWQKRSGLRLKIFVCAQFGKPTIGPKSDKLVWILVKYAQVHQYLIDKSAAQLYVVYIGTNSMTNMSLSVLQILMTYTWFDCFLGGLNWDTQSNKYLGMQRPPPPPPLMVNSQKLPIIFLLSF